MVLMLIAQALSSATAPPPSQARAMVRIERAVTVSEADWSKAERRSERLVVDERGQLLQLRLVEFE
jgi:hypothetical protein